ncbi:RhoGAP-domain-containing protein [Amylocystis lapponica]|nr:RhoGAP-domain-containing protein [Amylocystis lapponica]
MSSSPSMSEAPQDAFVLFDLHLKFLTDSYLSFFQERVESLFKLHRRVQITDAFLDDRGDPTTTRAAWADARDNVGREADTRAAFLGSLQTDVINPLITLRETQDRIRKRVKEDVKDAVVAHAEYAENTLPRLKRTYLKKCQEAEEYKSAQTAVPAPLSPTVPNDYSVVAPRPSAPRTSQHNPTRPVVTSPQPLRPLDRRPSTSATPARARSPPSSTAFQDLAHSGKRQLNQLMTFLDKGGNNKESLGRSDNALRSVKAKREADEADKEYRKAVHWLETLRLHRVKTMESGYNSVESFIGETAETVKSVLRKYTDNITATSATQRQLYDYGRTAIDKISAQKDSSILASRIPRLLASATPKPVYYYNFTVGECKDLVFGVTLVDYATARGLGEGEVPKIVKVCVKEIEKRGLDAEGIYRVSGRYASVQELQHKAERNEAAFAFNPAVDDVYAVSSLLKQYLRELPEPVFKMPLPERLQHSGEIDEHLANNFALLRSKMRRLPAIHYATLKMIIEHLARVTAHHDKNKMDSKNLAIVFGVVIFGEDELPKGGDLLSMQPAKDTLMEDLINHFQVLFHSSDSPSLPPAPLGETAAVVTYGSTHTKLTSMPQRPQEQLTSYPPSPRRIAAPIYDALQTGSPEDFTPRLPPRPAGSIHPSLRAGPMSAQPSRQSLQLPPSARSALLFDDQMFNSALPPTPREQSAERSRSRSRGREGRASPSLTLPLPSPPLPLPLPRKDAVSVSAGISTVMGAHEGDSEPTLRVVETGDRPEESGRPSPVPSPAPSSAVTLESAEASSGVSPSTSPSPAISEPTLPDTTSGKAGDATVQVSNPTPDEH